jgi:hypothetical protein
MGIITVNEQKTHSLGILTIFHFYCPTLRLLFDAETLGSNPVPNMFVIVRTKSHVGLYVTSVPTFRHYHKYVFVILLTYNDCLVS